MEPLRIYRINEHYVNYLHSVDHRVQYNKGQRRPYVGVVLLVGKYKYFVPMESPKPNHAHIKSGVHLMPLAGGQYGLLGFNNMIPVPDYAVIPFDIDGEKDPHYADLLRRQAAYINRNKADIYHHAESTYYKATNGKNAFLLRICCDFIKLEKAMGRYDPEYAKRRRPNPRKGSPN